MPLTIAWENSYGTPFTLEFDAVVKETHQVSSTVTKHPIEDGADIADHVRPENEVLLLEAVVTNTPILDKANGKEALFASNPIAVMGAPVPTGAMAISAATPPARAIYGFSKQTQTARVLGSMTWPIKPPGIKTPHKDGRVIEGQIVQVPKPPTLNPVLVFTKEVDRVAEAFDALYEMCNGGILLTVVTDWKTYQNMVLTSRVAPREGQDSVTFSLRFEAVKRVSSQLVSAGKLVRVAESRARAPDAETVVAPPSATAWNFDSQGISITANAAREQEAAANAASAGLTP